MFRQFLIHQDDRDWLRIVWRDSPDQPLQHLRLKTVTYGTACAPFQAIRALQQLAMDEQDRFPLGAAILRENTYVDDAFAGADTLEQTLEARNQFIAILRSAGMKLDKWTANTSAILSNLSDVTTQDRQLHEDEVVSTLGMRWKPAIDSFCFRVLPPTINSIPTKRNLLSVVARLFDPVGWLGPVLIRAKIFIQMLWLKGCNWDQHLDEPLRDEWLTFCEELIDIESIIIPRFFGTPDNPHRFLHGFCDASERAYAAAIYCVSQDTDKSWRSTLMVAKTRVAPIKTISLPRLELCGAVLLARLIATIAPQLNPPPAKTFCWSYSTVTLAWLHDHSSRWTTFVANRVGETHTLLPNVTWNHVRSKDNPADCASRGLSPKLLKNLVLWWNGPLWLLKDWDNWTPLVNEFSSTLEQKCQRAVMLHGSRKTDKSFDTYISRFSSSGRLFHAYAYIFRWFDLRRLQKDAPQPGSSLTAAEIAKSTIYILRNIQREFFSHEMECLRKKKPLPKKCSLRRCLPFIDEHGILRVGGRLQNMFLSYEEKHPAIIPRDSHLATLIIRDAHNRTLHGGPQLVLSHIRRRFWIPQARNKVRRQIRLCTRCARFQGRVGEQQMAPLPELRERPARAFSTCGIDYAGPFAVRTLKGRGQKSYKGYVCIFVCLATRAIHLEVVSDYSSKVFLEAFSRFTSRRGIPTTIYSDNGTTFKGASTELRLYSTRRRLSARKYSMLSLTTEPSGNSSLQEHDTSADFGRQESNPLSTTSDVSWATPH